MPRDVPSARPGVVFADIDEMEGAHILYDYSVRANWQQGSKVALGLLDGEFESKEWVEARSFGREGNQIRLELTYHPARGKPAWKDQPDGRSESPSPPSFRKTCRWGSGFALS